MEQQTVKRAPRRRTPFQRNRRLQGEMLTWLLIGCILVFTVLSIITPDREFSESENRSLAQFPKFGSSFLSDLGTYVADQFPGRDLWMRLNLKMNQLLGMEDRPTAVFLSNYETALGGMMAINESEISCPQDISIFAFDDLLVSGVVRPKLWLMVQPMESLCNNAVRILLERVEGEREDEPIKLSFSAKLQEGNSILNLAQNVSL